VARLVRFGSFELDLGTADLRNNGRSVRLPEQQFQLLIILLEQNGSLVSRDEIRRQLWPNDTVVEFDRSINAAVMKLRITLGDTADKPVFIETLARRGYRFLVRAQFDPKLQPENTVAPVKHGSLVGCKVLHYRILDVLGGGGMGLVYRGEDLHLNRPVALKFLPEEVAEDTNALRRLEREARTASSLNHPNICTIYQVEEFEGQPFIVMELLEGETLRTLIARQAGTNENKPSGLAIELMVDMALQITEGLQAAHQKGIIHRDIKPANIFLTTGRHVKILDFGLAKVSAPETDGMQNVPQNLGLPAAPGQMANAPIDLTLSRFGITMGTVGYMSPEQIRGEKLDFRTDLFSFGLILYEMVTGRRAFVGETLAEVQAAILHATPIPVAQLNSSAPDELGHIINKCLEKDRNHRYQHVTQVRDDLLRLKQADSARILLPGTVAPSSVSKSKAWIKPWILGTACALAVISAVLVWLFLRPAVPAVESVTQITSDGEPKFRLFTDGSRIYFAVGDPGARHIAQVSATGGPTGMVENAPPNTFIQALTPDGGEMLLMDDNSNAVALPLPAGQPRRLLDGQSIYDLSLFPDGKVIYSTRKEQHPTSDLMLAEKDGSHPRKIRSFNAWVSVPGVSPDGQQILICVSKGVRCTLQSLSIDGAPIRTILEPNESINVGSFRFSHDQKYLVFNESDGGNHDTGSQDDIWALSLDTRFFRRASGPYRLTSGPLSYTDPVPSPDGKRIFVIGTKAKAELVRYEPKTHQYLPWRPGLSATQIQFSPDGKWMVYVSYPDFSLWRSRIDGSEKMQLTFPPMQAGDPHFSPDGKTIAFDAGDPDNESIVYLVDISGGPPRKVAGGAYPDWSPDGTSVAVNAGVASLINLETGKTSHLPDGWEKVCPEFVDSKTLLALDKINHKFVTFDLTTSKWRDLISLHSFDTGWEFSPDRKFIYISTAGKDIQIQRIALSTKKVENLGEMLGFHPVQLDGGIDFTVLSDGSIIFPRDLSSQEIYALNVRWP
jgi:serine/threonine protein kinase/Tol biopolymer transport system component